MTTCRHCHNQLYSCTCVALIPPETIEITKKEFFNLKLAWYKLKFLEMGGVDNWEWYTDSLYPDHDRSIEDIEQKIREDLGLDNE